MVPSVWCWLPQLTTCHGNKVNTDCGEISVPVSYIIYHQEGSGQRVMFNVPTCIVSHYCKRQSGWLCKKNENQDWSGNWVKTVGLSDWNQSIILNDQIVRILSILQCFPLTPVWDQDISHYSQISATALPSLKVSNQQDSVEWKSIIFMAIRKYYKFYKLGQHFTMVYK